MITQLIILVLSVAVLSPVPKLTLPARDIGVGSRISAGKGKFRDWAKQ